MQKRPLTVKNQCKLCQKSVSTKTGLQCRGACKRWLHFDCLNFTPGKIEDIKNGLIQINCPCPTCNTTVPKEIVLDPPFLCKDKTCPAIKPPQCEEPGCPSHYETQDLVAPSKSGSRSHSSLNILKESLPPNTEPPRGCSDPGPPCLRSNEEVSEPQPPPEEKACCGAIRTPCPPPEIIPIPCRPDSEPKAEIKTKKSKTKQVKNLPSQNKEPCCKAKPCPLSAKSSASNKPCRPEEPPAEKKSCESCVSRPCWKPCSPKKKPCPPVEKPCPPPQKPCPPPQKPCPPPQKPCPPPPKSCNEPVKDPCLPPEAYPPCDPKAMKRHRSPPSGAQTPQWEYSPSPGERYSSPNQKPLPKWGYSSPPPALSPCPSPPQTPCSPQKTSSQRKCNSSSNSMHSNKNIVEELKKAISQDCVTAKASKNDALISTLQNLCATMGELSQQVKNLMCKLGNK